MHSLKNGLWNTDFSHIYVEKKAADHPRTKRILSRFKNSRLIEIDHYKDIFCRSRQSFVLQKHSPKLILAIKEGNLVYKGARVCQDFGNHYFYYTSSVMNCPYNCEYCYLQGMYPSANIVVFVNLEDIFFKVEKLLAGHPVYLCISYDTDLLALEGITGFVSSWLKFASRNDSLIIELRTKSANFNAIKDIPPLDNVILAWTLSPTEIIKTYEQGTPSLEARLDSIKKAVDKGWKVRLCFDPMVFTKDWKRQYGTCVRKVFEEISAESIYDVSLGVFRISKDYLKRIQKERPRSLVFAYPFEEANGICTYSPAHTKEMMDFLYTEVGRYIPEDKIYRQNI